MALIKEFLEGVDASWTPIGGEPLALQVIGSMALMLQTDYDRGTKDGDVLESRDDSKAVKERLLRLAGRGTDIHARFRLYIDVVPRGLLFLPPKPVFHPLPRLKFKNFKVEVLDVGDVILSKLKLYRPEDANDARAMADRGLLDHAKLVKRFEAAADWFSLDARATEVPGYLKHLHTVEREILGVPLSPIDLPAECLPE